MSNVFFSHKRKAYVLLNTFLSIHYFFNRMVVRYFNKSASAFFIFFLICTSAQVCQAQEAATKQELLDRAAAYEAEFDREDALDTYLEVLKKEPQHYEALWRTAVLYSQTGNKYKNKEDKKAHYEKGLQYAKKALTVNKNAYTSHYAMAVSLGALTFVAGNNVSKMLDLGKQVRKYTEKALELNPRHAESLNILAAMHVRLGDLNYVEKVMAGDLAKGMSIEKGLNLAQKAISLQPQNIEFYLTAANASEKLGKKKESKAYLQQALQLQPRHNGEARAQKRCEEMLSKL
jgi:regulator of microtubule dynamics protein 3